MKLCITEKPSVARDIATILGANDKHDGYFEGNGYRVTWTFGHLCTLKEPADYTPAWKRWALSQLPMIPSRFGIKVIPEAYITRQFNVIKQLIAEAAEVINCGDAGQEGELIQRWVMQKAGIKCPVYRLWISSLTDESIRQGFDNLKPESDFNSLYHAGLSRAIGDWLLGLNATRLYSLKYSSAGNVLSIGRVQTPTLSLIVQRQREVDNFIPEDYWEIRTVYRDIVFNGQTGRFKTEQSAADVVSAIADKPFTVVEVTEKRAKESAPRLFDLTSLQVECNKKWGWSADDTLSLIQSLYEKKVTTYPRVDTTYLSTDIYAKIPDILRKMTPYAGQIESVLASPITKSKRIFDNSKVTDHHAIIPTGHSPASLIGNERQLYHLIAMRFIAAFYPDCEYMQTTVSGRAGDVDFKANGKVLIVPGWRTLYAGTRKEGDDAEENKDDEDAILPDFTVNETGPHQPSTIKRTTQPPKLYTEGSLLRAMESAGKTVDDETLREALKANGIGRPSTRSAIIETLFKRRYIQRRRKSIVATEAGIQLIDTIKDEILKSAALTGIWEHRLRLIEQQEYSPAEFIEQLKQMVMEITAHVMADDSHLKINVVQDKSASKDTLKAGKESKPAGQSTSKSNREKNIGNKQRASRSRAPKSVEDIVCPLCHEGHLIKGRRAYGCSRYASGCNMLLPFTDCPADASPAQINRLINKMLK